MQVDGLARAQQRAGHEVHIITATRANATQPEVRDGVTVHRLSFPMPADLPLHPRALSVIAARLQDISPDIVHVHVGSVSFYSWSGIRAALRRGLPVVTTVHSMWGPLARRLFWFSNKLVHWSTWTALTAVSAAAAAPVAAAASVSRPQVLVTSNGVDLERWKTSDNVRVPQKRLAFVSATRFAPRKRVLPLIDVFAKLHSLLGENCPTLTIAGNGPSLERVRSKVRAQGLESVIKLPGRIERDALAALYAESDIYIQLSVRESFGLAAIEARAAGLPVLGRAGNGFSEFIAHGSDGFLEPSDAAVTARIVNLIEQPTTVAALTEFAVAHPPINTWEFAVSQVQSAYDSALSNRLR